MSQDLGNGRRPGATAVYAGAGVLAGGDYSGAGIRPGIRAKLAGAQFRTRRPGADGLAAGTAYIKALDVAGWTVEQVHAAMRRLKRDGFEFWAVIEGGDGELQLWLIQERRSE